MSIHRTNRTAPADDANADLYERDLPYPSFQDMHDFRITPPTYERGSWSLQPVPRLPSPPPNVSEEYEEIERIHETYAATSEENEQRRLTDALDYRANAMTLAIDLMDKGESCYTIPEVWGMEHDVHALIRYPQLLQKYFEAERHKGHVVKTRINELTELLCTVPAGSARSAMQKELDGLRRHHEQYRLAQVNNREHELLVQMVDYQQEQLDLEASKKAYTSTRTTPRVDEIPQTMKDAILKDTEVKLKYGRLFLTEKREFPERFDEYDCPSSYYS